MTYYFTIGEFEPLTSEMERVPGAAILREEHYDRF